VASRRERGWPADSPLLQPPNAPLLVAQGGWLVAAVTQGAVRACARVVFLAGLAVWAWQELASGANWVRRLYGVAGLAYVGNRIGAALGRRAKRPGP
jgi:hypothetical protein